MKKLWILCFLAIVSQPLNTYAASNVDLSRVKFSSGSEPLVFTFGNLKVDGVVEQVHPFTEEEINKLVQNFKIDELIEDDIEKANREVEKAKRASEFTKEDYERVKRTC